MVEKLGHKKRVQMMRMEWINEGRPKPVEDNIYDEPQVEPREPERQSTKVAPIFEKQATDRLETPATRDNDNGDIYGATPKPTIETSTLAVSLFGGDPVTSGSTAGPKRTTETAEDGPPEDDLDALFAEDDFLSGPSTSKAAPTHQQDAFDDDEEAMAKMGGMDDMW